MSDKIDFRFYKAGCYVFFCSPAGGFSDYGVVVYISYNPKYKIRYRIVNDLPADIEYFVAESWGWLDFILWRADAIAVSSDTRRLSFQ